MLFVFLYRKRLIAFSIKLDILTETSNKIFRLTHREIGPANHLSSTRDYIFPQLREMCPQKAFARSESAKCDSKIDKMIV